MKVIWNKEIVDRASVKIDLEDRGYQFGDGLYEVIRAYNGTLFTIDEHIDRMFRGADKIDLKMPFTKEELKQLIISLIKENQIDTGNIYFQLTRGNGSPRNHAYPDPEKVTPVFTASTTVVPRDAVLMSKGVAAITIPDMRWLHCDIKSISLLGNVMAKHEAHKVGAFEAIQHRDGIVTEASSSNSWMIKDDVIYTHPDGNLILAGITKLVILKIAREAGLKVKEEPYTLEQLKQADEVFISSTTLEVMPVVTLDGASVGDGKVGPIVTKLQELYAQEVTRVCGELV
ncbi:D-amino-acid transaminase [Isobaculum melis]|uniref:D-alanine aminotransferase n=1 Tax=Isobaculum melis TaxID=142588 RepID=A0A1H9S6Y9_9LACT|nr:D-amino-acid transaminase [Isobaculum melis]SER80826.1 D-alanine aminotransferase apoenzyme [Isobaculum melis]